MELRTSGVKYREIAAAARLKFGARTLPRGWDARYAYKDLQRLLEQTEAELQEGRELLRKIELDRLDDMTAPLWLKASAGDKESIQLVLNLMNRRAKLTGIDAPIEYTIEDIRALARKVHNVIDAELRDEDAKRRIFAALGFTSV